MSNTATEAPETMIDSVTALGALDVCDSCGAQAYVRATLTSGELLFCGHHAAKHRESLGDKVVNWHDETSRLRDDNAS
ncbi:MAG: hypothetical protein QNL53_03535 [Microbacteriaceae bacterium]|jgi:hypothetical protein|nr:MAG: hypothetical protein ABR66_05280 [Microbacteriaceae bacterium BACL25 MAG-120322-bin65]HAA79596.1 hypothetical protein [Microbacteriaceae bacterium]